MSPPFRPKDHQDKPVGRPAIGLAAGRSRPTTAPSPPSRSGSAAPTSPRSRTAPAGWKTACRCLWTAGVNTGRITKEEFVAVTSANIARILNVYPQKGAVAVGSDADLVIWDPKASKTISAKKQISRIDYNVFEGFRCTGLPRATLVARRDYLARRRFARRGRRRQIRRARSVPGRACRQRRLARTQRPAPASHAPTSRRE